ncbi:hypothetical protein T281_16165 [Rhodomicrobium udaipurense JA643]|uniref:AAA family ATPase n=1 Tax=Rhodomicrobium udaipurense TaxID=1202716 RepID=A0A8I1GEP6_9HYPH|nr:AAA family ATPase [Rhodomicrobium udaipurense]KAI93527.1 hypothetical protein T281_16165 [Rhodomicrobium udaipurense JA643]MBJ7543419.1 AAA family ATPase [Rhodomicrobium udaipurense]
MAWFEDTASFVSSGFGLFAWDKAHAILGTIAALISVSVFALRQVFQLRKKQSELDTRTAELSEAEKQIAEKQKKLEIVERAAQTHETHLWDLWPNEPPEWFCRKWPYFSRRVITLANFKGGVGKTTIAANLAIAIARKGYRVLIIDLDYQGSLDGRFNVGNLRWSENAGTNALLAKEGSLFDLSTIHKLSGDFEGIWLVPAFYALASLENRLMLQWLLQSCEDDIRFRIAEKILDNKVEGQFDVVIMDTPPRLTAATVNALCVSTDVLIPTVVDSTSMEAVLGFAQTVSSFRQRYNPRLEIAGVIPSLTFQADLKPHEIDMLRKLDQQLVHAGFAPKVLSLNVPRKSIREVVAGDRQLYFADDNCRSVFDRLVESLKLSTPLDTVRNSHENSGFSVSA